MLKQRLLLRPPRVHPLVESIRVVDGDRVESEAAVVRVRQGRGQAAQVEGAEVDDVLAVGAAAGISALVGGCGGRGEGETYGSPS